MGMARGEGWTKERDELLRKLIADGKSQRQIGRAMDLDASLINRRIKKLGLSNPEPEKKSDVPLHIQNYRAARRGFSVPPHLENQYIELLRTGLSIDEVCRRLKIVKPTQQEV